MAFAYAVALTGGIATGKSTVARMFENDGFVVLDADKTAHRILDEQREKIAEMFGEAVLNETGVDRKALGAIVFADPLARKRLEKLLHPLIFEHIANESERLDALSRPYIVDIPLFYEGGRYPIKKAVVVYAPQPLQIRRAMERDGLSEEAVLERIAAQIDIEEKRFMCDYLIRNDGDEAQLRSEYEKVRDAIVKEFA
jgi:dephospho-CoA kinase